MAQDLRKGRKQRAEGGSAIKPAPRPAAEAAPAVEPATVSSGVTPSMAQFLEIKAANPDCMLFYRMGDFYELFFEDAVAAAEALGIVLTKRGKHLGEDIPMCGVPIHRADEYLQRLITRGFPGRRLRADGGSGGSQEARLQGGRASRRRAPRHARHADRGKPARRQGAQLPHRAVQGRRTAASKASRRACLARHLDRRVRGGRSRRPPTCRARSSRLAPARSSPRTPPRRCGAAQMDRDRAVRRHARARQRTSTASPASGN